MTRLAAASLAGTAVEFYDFLVYGTAAALVLGPLFFPSFSPVAGTLAAFATFGAGFVARPLGSVLFGHLGDRYGRRPVLLSSLLLTGLATVGVGCLPTYASIGAAAPALLVSLRFLQGLGVGGEWGGAVLLMAEHAPARRRGLWTSFPQLGAHVGFLLANGTALALSAGLTDAQFRSWGWRVPFWAAGLLAALGLLLRRSLPETPEFMGLEERSRLPVAEVARRHWRRVLLAAGAVSVSFAMFYTVTTWSLAYVTAERGMSRTPVLGLIMAATTLSSAAGPVAAVLGDRFGRRPLCVCGVTLMALWVVPMLRLLESARPAAVFTAVLVASLALTPTLAVTASYLPELFAPRIRCTAAAVSYNLAGVLGGALTPLAATALTPPAGVPWAVGAFLTGVAALSLTCFLYLPETRPARVAVPATA
ncbi:MFS transporter [Streptomyces smaragdinus]|uniref:MFS transporter n=1 Tax=Streptomyces smaragdinus TaxID=2585196 RepID=UPI00129616B7|nr:MFS transporter [Streptomyces smaragdinus]